MRGSEERWAVAIDLGGSSLKTGLVSEKGEVESFARTPFDRQAGPEPLLGIIADELDRLTSGAAADGIVPCGVGMGSPGSADSDGLIHGSPNIVGMDGFPLLPRLREMTDLDVRLTNDVNAAALAELKFGAGRDWKTFVMVAIGTGVGGGVVMDGALYQGRQGFAGEVGHITVDPDGPTCACGNAGCLERFVGAPGLVERTLEILENSGWDGPLARIPALELDARAISEAAASGDRVATQVLAEAGRWLGIAFISIINLLDPECIIVGGGVAQAGAPLFDAIRSVVSGRTMGGPPGGVPIIEAMLGPKAGMYGAGALALWPELT